MPILELGMVIELIAGITIEAVSQNLTRSEAVVRVLKKVGLDTVLDPQDFDSIYVYTVIEFGVYKNKTTLDIFRSPYVKNGFQTAFYEGKINEFQREVTDFVDRLLEQGHVHIDPKVLAEFMQDFSLIFGRIVTYSRTPAHAEDHLHILTMHESVKQIYLDIQGMKGSLTTAEQISKDKPDFWEFLLVHELLRSGLAEVRRKYLELHEGLVYRRHERLSETQMVLNWILSRTGDFQRLTEMVNQLVNKNLLTALGPPGEPGSVSEIRYVCSKLIEVGNNLWELECDWAFTILPEELDEVVRIMRWSTEPHISELEKIPQGLGEAVQVASKLSDDERHVQEILLVFVAPENLERCTAVLQKWLRNQGL